MLHIAKLCVGIADIADLRRHQSARLASGQTLRHLTRSFPRRAAEVTDGGSIYWVIAGAMAVRQRIIDIQDATYEDGSKCAALVFDPELVPLAARATRPFQGWRYLAPEAAPPDLVAGQEAQGRDSLPPRLRQELEALGLL
jgi:hypothetical protein